MSSYLPKRVLLADDKPRRAKAVERTLNRCWKLPLTIVFTPNQAFDAVRKANKRHEWFDVIMIGEGFGGAEYSKTRRELLAYARDARVLVASETRPLPDNAPAKQLLVIPEGASEADYALLEVILGAPRQEPPTISNGGRLASALELQIRELDSEGKLEAGKRVLRQLADHLIPEIGSFSLHGLGQGFSGAKVFRISYSDPQGTGDQIERVVKLTPDDAHQAWKCQHELRNYPTIRPGLKRGPLTLVPQVYGCRTGGSGDAIPAECENWLAVMYDFLGGSQAFVCDFERVFLDPKGCFSELVKISPTAASRTTAAELAPRFIEKLVEDLCIWYQQSHRQPRNSLWSSEEAPPRGPLEPPPYRFRRWEKTRILGSIRSLEQYGVSVKRAKWKSRSSLARLCVPTTRGLPKHLLNLGNDHRTLLTPVHADLNANNVLMVLDRSIPFLIDFACYQSAGHNVQDFARLEVAIKIELMGREVEGPEWKDLNSKEFPKWCEAEDWLMHWPSEDSFLRSLGAEYDSVKRAYQLCFYLREKAWEFHRFLCPSFSKADFILSYSAALLYHTLRTIGYDSVVHVKRVFAVYSAGGIAKGV